MRRIAWSCPTRHARESVLSLSNVARSLSTAGAISAALDSAPVSAPSKTVALVAP
jgi:hypothetical protein